MGLKSEGDLAVDDDGGGNSVPCSICLDVITDNGDRSWAKLQCGHQFHLDCIGSAFNVKGAMQCPNCRKVEKGQWLYANGCRFPEFGMDEWTYDDDIYDSGHSEMSFGVHWCPFGQPARLPSSFEDADYSSAAYPDVVGQHAVFGEHTATSSATHPCPYVGYFRPMHHPSTSSSSVGVTDATFSNPWSGPGAEIGNFTFPSMDHRFHIRDHYSLRNFTSSGRVGGAADQASGPPTVLRSSRSHTDVPRSGSVMHPFIVGPTHSPGTRSSSSIAAGLIPPYPGSNTRNQDRVRALQAYYQQQQPTGGPAIHSHTVTSARRLSSSRRGMAASSSEQNSGVLFRPNNSSSGHNLQELEDQVSSRFHGWEREHLPSGWALFPLPAAGGSEPSMRPIVFHQRYGSERTPSHNQS